MDTSVHLFSPLQRSRGEKYTNENPKTPAELLRYWLNSVHIQANKQNLKANIVLLLIHTDSLIQSQYIKSYIKTITDMVKGKPYETYITKENIILFDNCPKSFEDVRNKLFHRITMQPSWGVKRPIRWLHLEADLLRRTTYKEKSYLFNYELQKLVFSDIADDDDNDAERRPHLLVSEVKELALAYNMNNYEVDSFIEFHQALGDLICCLPSNGERCIITNPQWFMDRIKEFLSLGLPDQDKDIFRISQRKKGIVSTKYLHSIWKRYDSQFLIDLMVSFDFIFPLDHQQLTYLVPSMLPLKDSFLLDSELSYRAIYKTKIDDILSFGTFHRLLSLCAQQSNWKLNIGAHLSHSHASFEVSKGTHLVLTQMANNIVQVSTWTSKQELKKEQVSNDEISAILCEIHKDIARKMEVLDMKQSKSFRMLCPYWRPGDEYVCLVEIKQKLDPRSDKSNFVFYPKSEKCMIHNKALEPHLFYINREHRKGM